MTPAVQIPPPARSPKQPIAVWPTVRVTPENSGLPSGTGHIRFEKINNRTVPTRAQSSTPLKLLMPRSPSACGWVVTSTHGGGLVDGDHIRLNINAASDTRCLITTQASTKIYRTPAGVCRQSLHLAAADNAIVVIAPDPLVCFTGASFEQHQHFDLADSAGLLLIDCFTSGRWARGERWAFSRYQSVNEVRMNNKPIFRDALLLDPSDGDIAGPMRMANFDCFATLLIVGKPFESHAGALLSFVNTQPAPSSGASLIFAASSVAGGVVVRIAGVSAEAVGNWIRRQLNFIGSVIGIDPWLRKF